MSEKFQRLAIDFIRKKSTGDFEKNNHAITINFHPDTVSASGLSVLGAIARDGEIKSQFETGTSNGGKSAFVGGDRWLWEQRAFGGAYDNADAKFRPKYGALNYAGHEAGASPRFGSSHFCLKPHVLSRCTFCYPDSYFEPKEFAIDECVKSLVDLADQANTDPLDIYVEAHIHGEILLERDVECLVLDPAYRSTEIEEYAKQLKVQVQWHAGFKLSIDVMKLYPEYRGQAVIDLARNIAIENQINPVILGQSVNHSNYDQQSIKKIWHYLARYGYNQQGA